MRNNKENNHRNSFLQRTYIRVYIRVLASTFFAVCIFTTGASAQSSSTSYRLDYERNTVDAGYKQSTSYNLVGAISTISTEGTSGTYNLRNIYAGLGGTVANICGNGVIEGGEQCEGTNFNGLTCGDYGYAFGNLECINCQIAINCYNGPSEGTLCGNGIREASEQCDDGNTTSGDGCSSGCRLEDHRCGNGIVETGEECDDGNINTGDGCTPACIIELPDTPEGPVCGNGKKEETEECDDGNLTNNDGCSTACTIEEIIKEEGKDKSGDKDEYEGRDEIEDEYKIDFELYTSAESKPFYIIRAPPKTTFPTKLRAVAPDITYYNFHFEDYETGGIITILDETPFVVIQMETNETYELVVYDIEGNELERQGTQADPSGLLKAEVLPYLDYKTYILRFFNQKHNLVKEFRVTIEDREYHLHELTVFSDETERETICLGAIDRGQKQYLEGKGKPNTRYFAYFQSTSAPIRNQVNPITVVKVTADIFGYFKIPVPDNLQSGIYNADIVQVYNDGKVSRNKRYIFNLVKKTRNIWVIIMIALALLIGCFNETKKALRKLANKTTKREKKNKGGFKVKMLVSLLITLTFGFNQIAIAATTTPQVFIYEGKLLDNTNAPITTPQTFRFSLWNSKDLVAGDIDGVGAINATAITYSGWQESQTVTPNIDGTFFFELGSITPLPNMLIGTHDFLQVEIKPSGLGDTAYELMDPTGDNAVDADDRQTIGSSPFTNNADFIDNAELGINAGDIATLSIGDVWDINFIPGGTNSDTFILDYDDSVVAGDISLQFGNTVIAAILKFSTINNWFEFSDSVSFNKNEIKNVAIDNQASAPIAPTIGQIYHNTTDGNTYIWNGTVWEDITTTGSDDLDTVYTTDLDKIMDVNNVAGLEFESTVTGNITFDLQSTGDLVIEDSGTPFATFTDTGEVGIGNITPASTLHVDSNDANTAPILTVENTSGDMQMFRSDATPEGSITGSIGDITIDSTNGNLFVKNSGNATNNGWIQFGGVETKQLVFNAEYEDSVTVGDGSNNRGTLISDQVDIGANQYNYYEWTTAHSALNDVDVVLSVRLPEDFVSFTATPLEMLFNTSDNDTNKNKIDMTLYDSLDTLVPLTGSSNLANGSWSTANITFGGTPTFTAGQTITLLMKLSSNNTGFSRIADIVLNYNGT